MHNAQKGNTEKAQEQLQKIIVDSPERADILYDAAIVAYDLKNFMQAATYFDHAALYAQENSTLQCHAYFNAGNAYVEMQDLHKALECYDKALKQEPNNEFVRHNRDRVAQMIEEQNKKEQEQQENDQKNQDNQNNQSNKDQNQNQNSKDNEKNQNNSQENESNDSHNNGNENDQSDNDQKDNNPEQKDSQKKQSANNRDDTEDKDKSKQRENHGKNEKQKQDRQKRDQRNGNHEFDKKTEHTEEKGESNQHDQHSKTPAQQEQGTTDKGNLSPDDKQEELLGSFLTRILQDQEAKDIMINKQLIELKTQQSNGKNNQNAW